MRVGSEVRMERSSRLDTIKAMIRNGHVETDTPIDLPEGTEVLIVPSVPREDDDDWDDSPAGISGWLERYDALQPLLFTEGETQSLIADRATRKAWEAGHADDRDRKLRELWK
jgi:hypothetical protein